MSASAAVRDLFRIPRAGPPFRRLETGEDTGRRCPWGDRVESIRNILSQGGQTITQLSAATLRRYGSRSPYFIPATFLYQLRAGVTPHVCQIVALSESTGYRFVDWLRMCGFDLRQIPRLQMRLHSERTVLVTPMEDSLDPFQPQPSFVYDRAWSSSLGSRPGEWSGRRRYLFAKVGTSDARGCPNLLSGSIVRVDRCYGYRLRGVDHVSRGHLLWLVEQPSGLTCCRVRWIDDRQIVLLPSRPPWGCWPLRLPTEARILGLVDMDLRPLKQVKLQPRAGPMNFEQAPPAAHNRRGNQVFGLPPNLAWTHWANLPGSASAHSRGCSNSGKLRVRDCLGDAFGLRGHEQAAASYSEDIDSLRRLLHGLPRSDGGRRGAYRRFGQTASPHGDGDLQARSEFLDHPRIPGRAVS